MAQQVEIQRNPSGVRWLNNTGKTLNSKRSQKELHSKIAVTQKGKSGEVKRELGHEKEISG